MAHGIAPRITPPKSPVLFGMCGLWHNTEAIKSVVAILAERGFTILRPPPWDARPDIDPESHGAEWTNAHIRSTFGNGMPVSAQAPGLWMRHAGIEWGDHPGGLASLCDTVGLTGIWLAASLGWNSEPKGDGGCKIWRRNSQTQTFHIHKPWPPEAEQLLSLPCLALPASAHARLALATQAEADRWPAWMVATLRTTPTA